MSNINEVVLFSSKYSQPCSTCESFIQQRKFPIEIIRLDTHTDREIAINSATIPIRNVPSLIVSYGTGDVQVFVGEQKIVGWLTALVNNRNPNNTNNQNNTSNTSNDHEQQKPRNNSEGNLKKKKSKTSKKSAIRGKKITKFEEDDDGIDLLFESSGDFGNGSMSTSGDNLLSLSKNLAKSSNESIMQLAKRMQAEREQALNIKHGEM